MDSGRVATDRSQHIQYAGAALASRMDCFWKVQVWDNDGKPTPWSEPAHWVMGYLSPDDWSAKWIEAAGELTIPEEIEVLKATYRGDGGSVDVTEKVRAMVAKQQRISVQPRTFGQGKEAGEYVLDLEYVWRGENLKRTVEPNITVNFSSDTDKGKAAPHFRKFFDLEAIPETTRLTVNAAAFFKIYVNGKKVGKDVLTPAQSSTGKRIFSITYDV